MWIARDADGSLWLYNEKPMKGKHIWLSSLGIGAKLLFYSRGIGK
jgi:hypothetical protein